MGRIRLCPKADNETSNRRHDRILEHLTTTYFKTRSMQWVLFLCYVSHSLSYAWASPHLPFG